MTIRWGNKSLTGMNSRPSVDAQDSLEMVNIRLVKYPSLRRE